MDSIRTTIFRTRAHLYFNHKIQGRIQTTATPARVVVRFLGIVFFLPSNIGSKTRRSMVLSHETILAEVRLFPGSALNYAIVYTCYHQYLLSFHLYSKGYNTGQLGRHIGYLRNFA